MTLRRQTSGSALSKPQGNFAKIFLEEQNFSIMEESSPENHSKGNSYVEDGSSGEKVNLFHSCRKVEPKYSIKFLKHYERSDGAAIEKQATITSC